VLRQNQRSIDDLIGAGRDIQIGQFRSVLDRAFQRVGDKDDGNTLATEPLNRFRSARDNSPVPINGAVQVEDNAF